MLAIVFTGFNGTTSISISILAWQFILQHTAAEAKAVEGSNQSRRNVSVSKQKLKWATGMKQFAVELSQAYNAPSSPVPLFLLRDPKRNSIDVPPRDMGDLWPAYSVRFSAVLRQEFTIVYGYLLEGTWQIR